MNQAISSLRSSAAEPVGAGESLKRCVSMGSRMTYSRLIGALFLAAFFLYGWGLALVMSVTGAPNFLSTISAQQTNLVFGAVLMLANSVAVVGIGVLFFPILERHGKRTALAYLAARIGEAVFLGFGVLALLLLVPLGQQSVDAGVANALGSLALQSNTTAYQIAVLSLGIGSLFLCALLFRTRLVPRFLAVWGAIGYGIFLAGAVAELFGIHIGVLLSIPGGLFELTLGFWLLIKGFQREANQANETKPSSGS